MILNGAPDDIVYDDYDDSVVAASEAEIDEKYPEMRNVFWLLFAFACISYKQYGKTLQNRETF